MNEESLVIKWLMRAFSMGAGSGTTKNPNPFFSTVCRYCCYQAPVLDKGVASVAAVVATVAEVLDPVRHVAVVLATVAVLATAGKQREAGSGWMDRKQAGIVVLASLQQEPEQGS